MGHKVALNSCVRGMMVLIFVEKTGSMSGFACEVSPEINQYHVPISTFLSTCTTIETV